MEEEVIELYFPFLQYIVKTKDFHPISSDSSKYLASVQKLYKSFESVPQKNIFQFLDEILQENFLNVTTEIEKVETFRYCAKHFFSNSFDIQKEMQAFHNEEFYSSSNPNIFSSSAFSSLQQFIFYLERSFGFIQTLVQNIGNKINWKFASPIDVVIVGAGPAGLMSAIESYRFQSPVTLFEKRLNYTRNTWFDLEQKPRSSSLETLMAWGITFQEFEYVTHEIGSIITLRTQYLEKFLAKVVSVLGIQIHYGFQFLTFCNLEQSNSQLVAAFSKVTQKEEHQPVETLQPNLDVCNLKDEEKGNFKIISFHLLVGCDGDSSAVRFAANISSSFQEFVPLTKDVLVHIPDIHQTTMLVNFKPGEDEECPHLKYESKEHLINSLYPGLVFDGITSVWKRFYLGNCQLQILFNQEFGNRIVAKYQQAKSKSALMDYKWQDTAIPWNKLKQITDLLFIHSFSNISSLKEKILRKKSNFNLYDIEIFDVRIRKAEPNTKILNYFPQLNQDHQIGIVTLSGDASISAHFRLGIGINNAFRSLTQFSWLIENLNKLGEDHFFISPSSLSWKEENYLKIHNITQTKDYLAQEGNSHMIAYQLSTIFYESYCDFTVSFNTSFSSNYWEGQIVQLKDKRAQTFYTLHTFEEIQSYCPKIKEWIIK